MIGPVLVGHPRNPDLAAVTTENRHEIVLVFVAGKLLRGRNPLDNRGASQEALHLANRDIPAAEFEAALRRLNAHPRTGLAAQVHDDSRRPVVLLHAGVRRVQVR